MHHHHHHHLPLKTPVVHPPMQMLKQEEEGEEGYARGPFSPPNAKKTDGEVGTETKTTLRHLPNDGGTVHDVVAVEAGGVDDEDDDDGDGGDTSRKRKLGEDGLRRGLDFAFRSSSSLGQKAIVGLRLLGHLVCEGIVLDEDGNGSSRRDRICCRGLYLVRGLSDARLRCLLCSN